MFDGGFQLRNFVVEILITHLVYTMVKRVIYLNILITGTFCPVSLAPLYCRI